MLSRRIVLSFSGSGHLLAYQLGVAVRVLSSALGPRVGAFAGASGGATAAAVCALLRDPQAIGRFVEDHALQGQGFVGLAGILGVRPPTALDRQGDGSIAAVVESDSVVSGLSGALFIGVTECRTGRRALLSNFSTREQLLRCVLASSAIPRSAHPFDLLRSPHRPPTYPESYGVVVPTSCEHEGSLAAAAATSGASAEEPALPFSPHGTPFVDGALTAAVPFVPDERLEHITVTPMSGPRGLLVNPVALGGPREHVHVGPRDDSVRLPLVTPALAGMRCFLSAQNLRALQASTGRSRGALRSWYERGQQDAEMLFSDEVQRWVDRQLAGGNDRQGEG